MADENFNRNSVKELQKYLKERGVTFSDLRKAELVEICEAADRLGIDVDPDGLINSLLIWIYVLFSCSLLNLYNILRQIRQIL
jgi:hypothetical protein